MVTTPVIIPLKQIQLAPGSAITIADITWEQYEAILAEPGEARSTRIAYSNGTLEIMSPLSAHERPKTTFIPHRVQHALQVGTSQMLRNLKHQIAQGKLER